MNRVLLPLFSLWWREIIRFVRQRSRVTGSLLQPLVFWLLLGAGLGGSFRPQGAQLDATPGLASANAGYLEYAYTGTLVLIVLFTAIFSTISVIEDRREGFLQGVLVAPVPRATIVLGKVLGGTTLAVAEALLFLALAPLVGVSLSPATLAAAALLLIAIGFALTALGFIIAWRLDTTAGFHAIMNLLLLPMWLLSGAFFPASGAVGPIRMLMAINPLTYAVSALRQILHAGDVRALELVPQLGTSVAITISFALVMFAAAVVTAERRQVVS
jgi:ABC-2 type transport system permease protein